MITSHVWRAPIPTTAGPHKVATQDRPCAYMNCRQPRADHERAFIPRRQR